MSAENKKAVEILSKLRDKASTESARQATFGDVQRNRLIAEQHYTRSRALGDVATLLDEEIKKL